MRAKQYSKASQIGFVKQGVKHLTSEPPRTRIWNTLIKSLSYSVP
jgi:hypothetical protein